VVLKRGRKFVLWFRKNARLFDVYKKLSFKCLMVGFVLLCGVTSLFLTLFDRLWER